MGGAADQVGDSWWLHQWRFWTKVQMRNMGMCLIRCCICCRSLTMSILGLLFVVIAQGTILAIVVDRVYNPPMSMLHFKNVSSWNSDKMTDVRVLFCPLSLSRFRRKKMIQINLYLYKYIAGESISPLPSIYLSVRCRNRLKILFEMRN